MKILIYTLLLLFASCAIRSNVIGHYSKKGTDFEYDLILNRNHRFALNNKYFEGTSNCSGKWRLLSNDTILLVCDTTNTVTEILQQGYMTERNHKILIMSRRRLKFQEQVLTKQKN